MKKVLIGLGALLVIGGGITLVTTKTLVIEKPIVTAKVEAPIVTGKLVDKTVSKLTFNQGDSLALNGEVNQASAAKIIKGILSMQDRKAIYLLLDSPGGSVLDGAQIISTMESSKVPVYTICTKLCASMAFMIHQHGKECYMVDRAIIMAHPASGGGRPGQLNNQVSLLNMLNRYVDKLNSAVAKRAGLSEEAFRALYAFELWIDAEDATQRGFNDKIVSLSFLNEVAPQFGEEEGKRTSHTAVRGFKWD